MQKKLPVYYPENDLGICFTHTGFLLHPRFKEARERYWPQFIESFDKTPTVFVWQYAFLHDRSDFLPKLKLFNRIAPSVNIVICTNDAITFDYISSLGIYNISCILCNHNAAVDRNELFIINREIQENNKIWDSVYTGTLRDIKRHFLTHDLKNVCYLTGGAKNGRGYQEIYDDLHQNQTNAFTLIHQCVSADSMSSFYNMSKVGLCLSAAEGAMYSSIEYLLCGLPVVSTRSIGGRDTFFTDKNCILAEDNPESVKDCVDKWLKNYPNLQERYKIREDAICLQKAHTKNLKNKIKEVAEKQNILIDVDTFYKSIYCNKLAVSV